MFLKNHPKNTHQCIFIKNPLCWIYSSPRHVQICGLDAIFSGNQLLFLTVSTFMSKHIPRWTLNSVSWDSHSLIVISKPSRELPIWISHWEMPKWHHWSMVHPRVHSPNVILPLWQTENWVGGIVTCSRQCNNKKDKLGSPRCKHRYTESRSEKKVSDKWK